MTAFRALGLAAIAWLTCGLQTEGRSMIPDQAATSARVRGVVVDEAGRPVAGAEVVASAPDGREARGVTVADGSFDVAIPSPRLDGVSVVARVAGGDLLGTFRHGFRLTPEQAEAPARIVVKPGRRVDVRVVDGTRAPVAGARVEVAGGFQITAAGTTGADGVAHLVVPADARVEWVVGLKPGRGFDYAEFGAIDEAGRTRGGVPAAEVPATLDLLLDGARTVQIRAVDTEGNPLAGIGFSPWLLKKAGRRSEANLASSPARTATTGPDGVATFDWLPPARNALIFWPRAEGYAHRRVLVEEGASGPVVARMSRTEAIQGKVYAADGRPAPGIRVQALGSGQGMDNGRGQARTAADGSYSMSLPTEEVYVVSVEDDDRAAPSRLDVAVRPGRPLSGVDFSLSKGTILRGTVTVGNANRSAPKQYVRVDESGEEAPEEFRVKGDTVGHQVRRQFGVYTDDQGRYSIRVGPGTYTVMGPPRSGDAKLTVRDEAEVVRDFRMPRAKKGTITGRVVLAADRAKGVAGAKVQFVAANMSVIPFDVTADADGRFRAERDLDKLTLHAESVDGTLGAIVEAGAEDPEVVIAVGPIAVATGLLLDEGGKPAANQELSWGRRIATSDAENSPFGTYFAPRVTTDAAGKFRLPGLVVGQEYHIAVRRENVFPAAGLVKPEKPGAIDLGTLTIGAHRGKMSAEEMSSFRVGGPGPGDPAPMIGATTLDGRPLKLADLLGKYVLLDFWATWCGPCIGEIPNLQAVHDAFGKDGRLVILSLSVDDKIDEPGRFQEKRRLPWSQAFLPDGFHGPTTDSFGVRAIPAFVLVGPDGKIVAKGMRGEGIKAAIAEALGAK